MAEKNQTKSSGRGGARAGAGRPKGSATKRTREIADKAAAAGTTPLEVMLATMNALMAKAAELKKLGQRKPKKGEVQSVRSPLELMVEAAAVAKDAAPYMHPRLAAVEVTGEGGGPLQFQKIEREIVDPAA